jgi:arabinofuranan 3-O-arabinosyltransferase
MIVSLGENANAGWVATQDGRTLEPVVVDGWQQGWFLVDDTDPVHAEFRPDRDYRLGLAGGLVLAVALVAVVLLTRRRWAGPQPPSSGARTLPAWFLVPVALVGAGLVAGWAGVGVALVAAAAATVLRSRAPEQAPWVLAAPCLVASLAYFATPWGSASGWAGDESWPHYLVLASLVAAVATAGSGVERRPTPLRRSAGRSTRR